MSKTPYPHQTEGYNYLTARKGGQLWYDMRTGKSFTTLLSCHEEPPILLLGPLTTLLGWINEIIDMGYTQDDFVLVRGTYNQKRNLLRMSRPRFFLLNYDVAEDLDVANVRLDSIIPLTDWQWIVFDESYCLAKGGFFAPRKQAEKGSGRTMYWLRNLPKPLYQKRVALSGLPAPESPLNFASQYLITDGIYFGYQTWEAYVKRYWSYNKWNYKWEMKHPYHREEIKQYVAANSSCVRMQDVMENYAGELFTIWDIPLTEEQQKFLTWLESATMYKRHQTPKRVKFDLKKQKPHELCTWFNKESGSRNTIEKVQEFMVSGEHKDIFDKIWDDRLSLQMMTPLVKFGFAMQIVCGVHPINKGPIDCNKSKYLMMWYKEHKQPCVVLSKSRSALDNLDALLDEKGISHVVVHGGTSDEDREKYRLDFQSGKVDFFLGQTGVVKMGYDLSRTDYIFYISNDYSNNVRSQANKRGTHLTKTKPVTIIDLCAESTRERDLVGVLDDKYRSADEFVNQKVNFRKGS